MPQINNKNPNKKKTGTVPKIISSSTSLQQAITFSVSSVAGTSSSISTTTSTNRQNDCGKTSSSISSSVPTTSHHHKNTEIVAPTRRELNDLNDYLLSVAESSPSSSSTILKQQNSNNSGGGGITTAITNNSNLDTTCFDLDNLSFQENQRYCYPVRPIPRQHNNKETTQTATTTTNSIVFDNNQSFGLHRLPNTIATTSNYHLLTGNINNSNNNNINNNNSIIGSASTTSNTSTNLLNSAAAIGVVIPTTPNTTALQQDDTITNNCNISTSTNRLQNFNTLTNILNQACNNLIGASSAGSGASGGIGGDTNSNQASSTNFNNIIDTDLTWEQRLNFIQYFLSLTSKSNNKEKVLNDTRANMVNERKNETCNGIGGGVNELIVNSSSLEDVIQNETNDTRAHSVTSIHTLSDPNTPTYDELQSKLEASNRNIQNIKDQQQHLLRLQQAAKQQLIDMENIRNQTRGINRSSRNGTPEYESVNQVHDDMANLVNRMKTLTTLIQGQHELSALLGEDGPEVMAEQEALQRKLEELRVQKQDMKNIISELQEVSNSAERSAQQQQQQQRQQQQHDETCSNPVEYQRVVPIELVGAAKHHNGTGPHSKSNQNGHYQNHNGIHNGTASSSDTSDELTSENNLDEEDNPEEIAQATELIRQKMVDINAMKNQLKRLKDMMETVKMIEEKAEGKSIKDIGNESIDESIQAQSPRESQQKLLNRNVPIIANSSTADDCTQEEEEEMSEKVRMLHEMTQDLREQARQMSSERERLKVIKEEIKRRREIAEKNSVRENSVSRSTNNSNLNNEAEKQLLEAEYEAKKKEFQKLCQRLQDEDCVDSRSEDVQENDIHQETEAKPESSQQYGRDNWRSNVASVPSVHSCKGQSEVPSTPLRGKDSADSGAADVHGHPSIEAASFKSGSSRSYSVPPPMRSINNREMSWRKNSQDNALSSQFSHFIPPPPPPPLQQQSGMPSNWNPTYYYSTPYGQQQCSSHFHAGGGDYCPHQCHSNTSNNQQHNNTTSVSTDPVLIQQFIQTQQMLINSVSQCNQLLWHQQKEITNLNNAVLLLQERLLNSPDINLNRAESVPNSLTNNFCIPPTNRAQSDQPPQPPYQPPPMSPIRSHHAQNYNNVFHHNQRRSVTNTPCNHNHCFGNGSNNTSYNNFVGEQSTTTFPATTNLCSSQQQQQQVPPPQQSSSAQSINPNYLNNDIPPNSSTSTPILMHHHNNTTITPMQQQQHQNQNNSNLLNSQQNCLNSSPSNLSNLRIASTNGNGGTNNVNSVPNTAAAVAALNNQVPPGNRANNYWDNFRSYSRQNLLSSNSCKSNEEQNHHYQQQMNPINQSTTTSTLSTLFGPLNSSSSMTNQHQNLNGFRNLYQQQQQQSIINNSTAASGNNSNTTNISGNINGGNGIIANLDASKHVHTFRNQFNNINGIEQQQQQQQQQHNHQGQQQEQPQQHENSVHNIQEQQQQQQSQLHHQAPQQQQPNLLNSAAPPSNMENFDQQQINIPSQQNSTQNINFMDNLNLNDELFNYNNSNNVNCNNVAAAAAIFGSPDFRNMNFNFSSNEFHKKIPFKASCSNSTKRSRNSQSSPLNEIYFNQRMINNNNIGNIDNGNGGGNGNSAPLQQNEPYENLTVIHNLQNQQIMDGGGGTTIIDNNRNFNQFEIVPNNINNRPPLEEREENVDDDDDDDEEGAVGDSQNDMPEEMKRNLLKNALKNDKFTSKFFESLRENVCCEIHSILNRTETNPQCLLQLLKELHNYNLYKRSFSNGTTESNNDDNELYENENENRGNKRQQYLQQPQLQQQNPFALHQSTSQNQQHHQLSSSIIHKNQKQSHHLCNSSKISTNNFTADDDVRGENNQNNEIINSLINSQDLRQLAYKVMLESTAVTTTTAMATTAITTSTTAQTATSSEVNGTEREQNFDKDKKIKLKYDKISSSSSQRSSPKISNEIYRPDYEFVNYIISNIRNNIHQTHIDDEVIVRIARLTIKALENSLNVTSSPSSLSSPSSPASSSQLVRFINRNLLTSRDLYRRMKSFEVNDRDTFLARYETFLQTLFVMKVSNDTGTNISGGGGTGTMNNMILNQDQIRKFGSDNINNTIMNSLNGTATGIALTEEAIGLGEELTNINLSANYNLENAQNSRKLSQSNNNNNNNTKSNIPLGVILGRANETAAGGNAEMNMNKNPLTDNTANVKGIPRHGIINNRRTAEETERLGNEQQLNKRISIINNDTVNNAAMFFRNPSVHHHRYILSSSDTSVNAVAAMNTVGTLTNCKEQITPSDTINNSNNIMNEDLAEADQICSSNTNQNCSIPVHQQHNDNNSSIEPLSMSSLSPNHRSVQQKTLQSQYKDIQQHYSETIRDHCFGIHHNHNQQNHQINNSNNNQMNGNDTTEFINENCIRTMIGTTTTNYPNYIHESLQHFVVSASSLNQQQQQQHNSYDGNIDDGCSGDATSEYETQFFKKYWEGVAVQNSNEMKQELIGNESEENCIDMKQEHHNNCDGTVIIESDMVEDEIEDDCSDNNIYDRGDDGDDEEEDDRAQFMISDAACALVLPIIPCVTSTVNGHGSDGNLLTQQIITNTDSNGDDFGITSGPIVLPISNTIVTATGLCNEANTTAGVLSGVTSASTIKRNSVP